MITDTLAAEMCAHAVIADSIRDAWTAATTRSTLSVAASTVHRLFENAAHAAEHWHGYDGREFEQADRDARDALAALGWTVDAYNAELAARTSDRFAFFSGLQIEPVEPERASRDHDTREWSLPGQSRTNGF